jgi:CxxC motif-containing protein
MIKKMICIDCPQSCEMTVEIENDTVINLSGHKCPKGKTYAENEIKNPVRTVTGTALALGLSLKMVPVRTNAPIPKRKIPAAMDEIKKIKLTRPVKSGDTILDNFLGFGVKLIATREV